jgi:hypothetical protein
VREGHGFWRARGPGRIHQHCDVFGSRGRRRDVEFGRARRARPILESRKTIGLRHVAQDHDRNSAAQPFADRAELSERRRGDKCQPSFGVFNEIGQRLGGCGLIKRRDDRAAVENAQISYCPMQMILADQCDAVAESRSAPG